jgi:hypothetical protein
MKDPTLRRGDIVVLPGGPKVFKGGRSAPYRLSDFEDVSRTKLVGANTRRQLTAMPVLPAVQVNQTQTARRALEKQDNPEGHASSDVAVTGAVSREPKP